MVNSTLETIAKRYSTRAFTGEQVPDEELDLITTAAIQSPSGMNRQHWQVIVVKNSQLINELEEAAMTFMQKQADPFMYNRIMSRGGKVFYDAPCMIYLAIKEANPKGAELIDLGIIAQNIVLAATSLGIDSCHCGMAVFPFAGDKSGYFKEKLQFQSGYECGMAVLLGYAETRSAPHAADMSKITVIK